MGETGDKFMNYGRQSFWSCLNTNIEEHPPALSVFGLALGSAPHCLLHDELASAPDRSEQFPGSNRVTSYIKGCFGLGRHAVVPDLLPGCISMHTASIRLQGSARDAMNDAV